MWDDGLAHVLQSAATAFDFIHIHPFQDGNGRVYRCMIHHVLAGRKYTPPGMVFPVSSVMLDRIDDNRTTLQAHSTRFMDLIDWRSTQGVREDVERRVIGGYLPFIRTRIPISGKAGEG